MNKPVIIYDIVSVPILDTGLTFDNILHLYYTRGILLWDSTQGGLEPRLENMEGMPEVKVVDLRGARVFNEEELAPQQAEQAPVQEDADPEIPKDHEPGTD